MHYLAIYIEIDVICLIILGFIFLKTKNNIGSVGEVCAFRATTIAVMVMLAADIAWVVIEKGQAEPSRAANALINAFYMSMTGAVTYSWFIFSAIRLKKLGRYNRKTALFAAIPALVLAIMSFASIKTGWIFYIDANGEYRRGALYAMQLGISYAYLAAAAIQALITAAHERTSSKKREANTLATFILIPAVFGGIQAFVYGLPTTGAGATLSILMMFVMFMEAQISRDPLTGLSNRRRADEFLEQRAATASKKNRLALFALDIDRFKSINDTYGHDEGDRALRMTAEALMDAGEKYGAFIARTGGDEFIMIIDHDDAGKDEVSGYMQERLAEICERNGTPYMLSLSVGSTEFDDEKDTAESFRIRADKLMYEDKRKIGLR